MYKFYVCMTEFLLDASDLGLEHKRTDQPEKIMTTNLRSEFILKEEVYVIYYIMRTLPSTSSYFQT